MNTSYSTVSLISFHLWLEHYLEQNQQAYINTTTQFYYQPDPSLPAGLVAYSAPFRSFVYDSGVSGANQISSVSGSFGTISKGQSGMMVDYIGGRVLFNSAVGTTATVSGAYAFKELNVYKANETMERLLFADKPYLNSRFNTPATTGLPPGNIVTPCIFVSNTHSVNEDFALGGLYNTRGTITLNVLAENMSQLEGVMSALTDAQDAVFPQLNPSLWPLNEYGDYKSGYNYAAYLAQQGTPNNLITITEVTATKVSDYTKIDEAIFLAVIDVTIERSRTIR